MHGNSSVLSDAISAFVLCGGRGIRLRTVVTDRPKAMALISGTPFLELLIEQLRCQGIREVILGTGYMAEDIQNYFGDGGKLGVHIRYSREDDAMGTGGALKLAENLISDPILVLNGDSYVDWSLGPLLELFTAKDAIGVMVVQAVSDVSRYGSVVLDASGRVAQFIEKGASAGPGLINAGVYLLGKQVVRELPERVEISLEKAVFPSLLDRKVYGLVCTGRFIDIGVPDDFHRAQTVLASQAGTASRIQSPP